MTEGNAGTEPAEARRRGRPREIPGPTVRVSTVLSLYEYNELLRVARATEWSASKVLRQLWRVSRRQEELNPIK